MVFDLKYKYSNYSIWFTLFTAAIVCYFFIWQNNATNPVNFINGDARYYYYYLQSTFVNPNLVTYSWLTNDNHPLTHHPVGLSLILSPFFLLAYLIASILHCPLDGISLPFQISISLAALTYCFIGFISLKKLFQLNQIPDKITALIIPLAFFGTNLLHYTLTEPAMSHAYSFCMISAFLFHSNKFVLHHQNKNLLYATVLFAIILLIRVNNGLILLSIFFWFKTKDQCFIFFKNLIRNKITYAAICVLIAIILIQPLTWLLKENQLYANRYAPYGFYWLHPQLIKMLFGFDSGFFIYTPLCFLFLFGLFISYRENKFLFYALLSFSAILLYFFSAYCAYTYYDGLGIRVLVDHYAVFALMGAKLFTYFGAKKIVFNTIAVTAVAFAFLNLIYCYQINKNILLGAGMNFNKWKYVFLKTGKEYQNCLGGHNDLRPYSAVKPKLLLSSELNIDAPFDYSKKEYGIVSSFDSIGFTANRIQLKVQVSRKELSLNASKDVLVCAILEERKSKRRKAYTQYKLNETPALDCCDEKEYSYTTTIEANFLPSDRISVYVWNIKQQPFIINKFSVQAYDYHYNY